MYGKMAQQRIAFTGRQRKSCLFHIVKHLTEYAEVKIGSAVLQIDQTTDTADPYSVQKSENDDSCFQPLQAEPAAQFLRGRKEDNEGQKNAAAYGKINIPVSGDGEDTIKSRASEHQNRKEAKIPDH